MINVGFIGAGGIAQTHAAALTQVDGARLVAITDLIPGRAEALAQKFSATAVAGLAELVEFPGLDIVYVLTPPHVHLEQILAAIDAGLPIFCEKPLTLTLSEADHVLAAAQRAGEPRVVPAGSTYKLRNREFSFQGKRVFPSYLQAGPSYFVEKSKRTMIAQDISAALRLVT